MTRYCFHLNGYDNLSRTSNVKEVNKKAKGQELKKVLMRELFFLTSTRLALLEP